MAFIKSFQKENRNFNFQLPAQTTYSTGYAGGKKIFQINMYGTKWREFPDKTSQIIQLDKSSAQELVNLLKEYFDL